MPCHAQFLLETNKHASTFQQATPCALLNCFIDKTKEFIEWINLLFVCLLLILEQMESAFATEVQLTCTTESSSDNLGLSKGPGKAGLLRMFRISFEIRSAYRHSKRSQVCMEILVKLFPLHDLDATHVYLSSSLSFVLLQ